MSFSDRQYPEQGAGADATAKHAEPTRLTGWGKGCLTVLGIFLLGYLAVLLLYAALVPADTVELRIPNKDGEYLEVKREEGGFKTPQHTLTINHVRPGGWFAEPRVTRLFYYQVLAPAALPSLAALSFYWRGPDQLLIQADGRDYLGVTPSTGYVRALTRLEQ